MVLRDAPLRGDVTMKKLAYLAALAITLMACDETAQPNTVYPINLPIGIHPGTRLSPKLLLADDGTSFPHPTIWNDSEFGECVFRAAADGMRRCLPIGLSQPDPRYLDGNCLQEVFVHRASAQCMPIGNHVLVENMEQKAMCDESLARVLPVNKKAAAPNIYRKAPMGSCYIDSTYMAPDEVYLLSAEIPAAEFVSAWQ